MEQPPPSLLTDYILTSFAPIKTETTNFPISSIDYHPTGAHLITASAGSLCVYDMVDGERSKKVLSQKNGTDLVRWTHHPDNVVYTGHNGTLRYLSLYDNKHLEFFEGHTEKICSLDMSATSDQVVTASLDNTVRFWDLTSTGCVALMPTDPNAKSRPVVAFDPSGMLVVVASAPWLRMFNMAQLDRGPFLEVSLEDSINAYSTHRYQGRFNPNFTGCKFDATGNHIMLTTNQGLMLIIDSFKGTIDNVIGDFEVNTTISTEACFSPDSQYVLRGTTEGSVRCWNRATAQLLRTWDGHHTGPVRCLKFNPMHLNFTSTCNKVNMWLPRLNPEKMERANANANASSTSS